MSRTTQETFDAKKSINAGFVKKNRPPSAGIGRKAGVKNIVSGTIRDMINDFVLHNLAGAQDLYDRAKRKDPLKALQILSNFAEYSVPRLARTEMSVAGEPLIKTTVTNDAEADAVYQQMFSNPTFNLNVITFAAAPPHQAPQALVVAEQGPRPDNVVEFRK